MRAIKEICREIANDLCLRMPEIGMHPMGLLKISDIMPEEEWKESGVTCLAARPEMGKTALMVDLVLDAALWMEKPIACFSLELDERQLVYRMIESITGIWGSLDIRAVPRLASAIGYLENLNIYIDDTPGISISEMETKLKILKEVGMVTIDYIQLMSRNGEIFENRDDEVRRIVQSISYISKERKIPFLMLSQLTRSVDFRKNKRPRLDDLYYGVYSCDVDQVFFLYREKVYRGCSYRNQIQDDSGEIILAKTKSGIKKTVRARFDKMHHHFVKNEGYDFIVLKESKDKRRQYGVIRGVGDVVLLVGFGPDSSIYGYHDRHSEIANRVYEKYGFTVIVLSNPDDRMDSPLDAIEVIKETICNEPKIYYMENFRDTVLGEKMTGGTLDDLCYVGFTRLL